MERVTIIGGGPGAQTLLQTLKGFPLELRVVIPMVDSGGSTGKLREAMGLLPAGDARKCLAALASDEDELVNSLLNYRFAEGKPAQGHTVGNLILAALADLLGSEAEAIAKLGKITGSKGRVYPSTVDDVQLGAEYSDGTKIVGEDKIVSEKSQAKQIKRLWLEPSAQAHKASVDALVNSDLIVLGPANLHRSIIASLLVEGIPDAIKASSARVAYVANLSGIPGQTHNYSAKQHVEELENYLQGIDLDVVVSSTSEPPEEVNKWYKKSNKTHVENDLRRIGNKFKVIKADLAVPFKCPESDEMTFRHNPEKLSYEILRLAKRL